MKKSKFTFGGRKNKGRMPLEKQCFVLSDFHVALTREEDEARHKKHEHDMYIEVPLPLKKWR